MERWLASQINEITYAKGIDSAYRILENFVKNIGFNFCGISISSTTQKDFKTLTINNFPSEWNSFYEESQYKEKDPIVAHCNQSMMPFVWSRETFHKTPDL